MEIELSAFSVQGQVGIEPSACLTDMESCLEIVDTLHTGEGTYVNRSDKENKQHFQDHGLMNTWIKIL